MKATTHLPTETSVPTYMKSAMASNQNDEFVSRSLASPIGKDSGCVGGGNFWVSISATKKNAAPASDQKTNPNPPLLCNGCTRSGKVIRPRPKKISRTL